MNNQISSHQTIILLVIVTCLTFQSVQSLNGLKSADLDDDPDSENFEKYTKEDERDIHVVTHSIKRLIVRPDNEKYPYVVKVKTGDNDEIDRDNNEILLNYISPKTFPKDKAHEQGEGGPMQQEVTIKTSYIDMSKDIIVIPTGERGIGYPIKGAYAVFRKNENKTVHYMNLAYIRHHLKQFSVEWSILDASIFGRTRIEQEFCRRGTCDIFHHIVGTCNMASHKCAQPIKGPPAVINKFMWKTNTEAGGEVAAPSSDPMTVTLNLAQGASPTELRLSVAPQPAQSNQDGGGGWEQTSGRKRETESDNDKEDEDKDHIPNSLDLLMLKRDDNKETPFKANEAVTDAHFENVLVGTRAVKPAMLDCTGCEKWGDFLGDFEEDPEFSRLVGETASSAELRNDLDQDIMGGMENENFLKENMDIPYVGFGHCNRTDISDNHANNTKEIEDLGKFFLNSMKLQCDQNSENRVRSLFTSRFKLLEIQDDFSVGLAHGSPVLKYKILTIDEFKTVMTGAFMAKYIKLFRKEYFKWRINSTDIAPMDENISRNIRFFSKLILEVMDSLSKVLSQHFVRGHRFLLRILRDKFNVALVQVASDKGSALKEIWINDLYRLMGLKEFILYGMGPLIKSGTPIDPAFRSFMTENEKRIKRLVQAYGVI